MRYIYIQFIKFLLIGGLNTLFGYGIYAALIWGGFRPFLAVAGCTVLGVLFNFQSTGRLVFKNANPNVLLRFIIVYIFIYFLTIGILPLIISGLNINAYWAGAIVQLPMALLAFILQRKFVFAVS